MSICLEGSSSKAEDDAIKVIKSRQSPEANLSSEQAIKELF
jgi:hypothetical protein